MHKITVIFKDQILNAEPFLTKFTQESPIGNLEDILQFLEHSLKAAGYCFEGKLTIVNGENDGRE